MFRVKIAKDSYGKMEILDNFVVWRKLRDKKKKRDFRIFLINEKDNL